jgi:purine-nucleoside phosphorylase
VGAIAEVTPAIPGSIVLSAVSHSKNFPQRRPEMSAFDRFRSAIDRIQPEVAIVLGSGLSGVATQLQTATTIPYAEIPGLVPPTIQGHHGKMALGCWGHVPTIVCSGRVHFYEGHSWKQVTALVRMLSDFGIIE